MNKYILVAGDKSYELNTLEEIVDILLGKEYYSLSYDEQLQLIKKKIEINDVIFKTQCEYNINDVKKYILYLCKLNAIMLVVHKDENVFTKNMDKRNLIDNYIIINTFAGRLLSEEC